MSGYELSDKDIDGMVRWLQAQHPENANRDYAAGMLISMKLMYRKLGWDDPDKLEDFYLEYDSRRADQNGKTSEE